MTSISPPPSRIETIDLARGAALVAMTVYHFAFDLELFGLIDPGTTATGGWKWFARSIAGSFLFLVGFSLFLAHGERRLSDINKPAFLKRVAMITGGALVITIATWFATPDIFIFFGILHQIAFASLFGLVFLRLHWLVVLGAAIVFLNLRWVFLSEALNAPLFWWTGLQTTIPRSSDYVPVFPWFGMVLLGIAGAMLAAKSGILESLSRISLSSAPSRGLQFIGRHSLAYYLLHQPVLIALLGGFLWITGRIAF